MKTAPRSRSVKSTLAAGIIASTLFALLGALILAGCGVDPVLPDNQPPVLVSLVAQPEVVPVGGVCTVTVKATDPDGDDLTYEWTAMPGYLMGGGSEVSLRAESCCFGGNTVFLTIKDGRGGETRSEITVGVGQ